MDELGDRMSLDRQKDQLKRCLERLTERNRELVRRRYFEEQPLNTISEQARLSMGAVYTAFTRIHAALLRCMEKASRREGGA
jgi:DNA-directed RNA polymerase specialized sigma24 family protein